MSAPRNQIVLMALIMGYAVLSSSQAERAMVVARARRFRGMRRHRREDRGQGSQKAAALSECNAKFAGRRKPGGGYTYFDFMQNEFDIAGPNPTPEEQRQIDEQYAVYLENQRRSSIAAAFAAKQQQLRSRPR